LAAEVKRRSHPALGRTQPAPAKKRPKKKRRRAAIQRVRTVVATMADAETFGWQMAAEVQRRGLDRAARKACVCDGQKYNWTLFEMHLLPWGASWAFSMSCICWRTCTMRPTLGRNPTAVLLGNSMCNGCVGRGRGRSSCCWQAFVARPRSWTSPRQRQARTIRGTCWPTRSATSRSNVAIAWRLPEPR
jgi:hypothetical protein